MLKFFGAVLLLGLVTGFLLVKCFDQPVYGIAIIWPIAGIIKSMYRVSYFDGDFEAAARSTEMIYELDNQDLIFFAEAD